MKNSLNYKLTRLLQFSIILICTFFASQVQNIYAQEISAEESARNIVREFINKNSLPQKDGSGNKTTAIKERYFTGFAANDYFGNSVSTAGDVNGDGYADMIIGAYGNDALGNSTGRAYIYYGGLSIDNIPAVILTGEAGGDFFGYSVSAAGDVNGDGYADVIVGAYGNDAQGNNAGSAHIYFGGSNMDNTADVVLTGVTAGDQFGISVSTAGDVNGDGYADVIIGANGNGAGGAYIYFGGSIMNNVEDVSLIGEANSDLFGYSVSAAGDVNGDGYADVIVGAYGSDAQGNNTGSAYIYFGNSSMDNTIDIMLTGATAGDQFGISVATAGDVNGDGYADVIVGANGNDAGGNAAGRAYIYNGGFTMDNNEDVIITGTAAGDFLGASVSTAGDINGDGFADVIVGAYTNDAGAGNSGRAYIYFGTPSMDNIADVILTGAKANDQFGISVSTVGDVNGDGYADVIVGANGNDAGGSNAGRAYFYTNSLNGTDLPDEIFTGASNDDQFGYSVSTAGDVNGDGYDDVIVGAPFNDDEGPDVGIAYIFYGGSSLDYTADVILTGASGGDLFGISVSTAGDVNGDGYDDVIVGASSNDFRGIDAGRAYIYYGGAIMNNIADVILTSEAAYDWFGYSVSAAGDVNGDGYADVIVGAYLNDFGGGSAGRAYIYYGGSSMDSTKDVILTGASNGDYFGYSVSTAGDVNGDGYDDVIVGAYLNDDQGGGSGKAYLYFGGSSMNNIADIQFLSAANIDYHGYSVSTAGDVNGDGYSDVIVGAYGNDAGGISAGRVYIYYGGLIMDNTADVILTGAAAGDLFGISVSTAGDVNGDGYADVLVGANSNDAGGSDAGRAYIYYGGFSMDNKADVIFTGATAGDLFGTSLFTAGDVNGDGYADAIVGAFYNDAIATNAGRAYLYLSSSPPIKPRIMFVKDVPGDQGGFLNINFVRSGYDVKGINKITSYMIERSNPPGNNGFFWNQVGTVTPLQNQQYGYVASTSSDYSSSTNGTFFFRITARTTNPDEYWRSNIMSGHSVDNLSPAAPLNFRAFINPQSIKLSWMPNSEKDIKEYQVFKSNSYPSPIPIYIGSTADTTFVDSALSSYYYLICAVDVHNNKSPFAVDSASIVNVEDEVILNSYELYQNYPNPWNPLTTIGYELQEKSNVKLSIFNAIGEEIVVLVNRELDKGYHNVEFNGSNLPSGVYFYKLVANNFIGTKKMMLIK